MSRLMSDQTAPERIRKLKILARVAGQIHAARNEKETLRLLVTSAMELVDACCGTAGLLMHEQMVFCEYHQNGAWVPVDYSFGPGQGVPGWMIENRKSYFSNDAEHDPEVDRHSWQSLEFYNLIDVPIIGRQGQLLGCFNIHNSVGHRPFDEQDVAMLEMLAENAALALENLQVLAQQIRSYQSENVLNKLLQLSMQDMPLSELFEQALDTILDTPWLPLNRAGAIFLIEKDKPVLEMKAQQGLSVTLQSTCASVPFGCCVCGVAAANREALFAEYGDERHDFCRDSMGQHAHYAIPLVKGDAVLGLITLYLDKGHQGDDDEMNYLNVAARILTGVILRKQAEEALRESNSRLMLVLDATNDGVWDWNIQTGKVFFSSQWKALLGYSEEDVPNDISSWKKIVHPDDMPQLQIVLQEHFDGKTSSYQFENRLLMKNGEYRCNLDRGKVVEWDTDGQPLRMVGTDTDITERKRTEAEMRKLSQAIEQGDEGVLMTDTNSVIEYVNPAFCNITGYSPEEAIGKTPAILKSTAQDPDFYKEMWQTISSGKIWHGTLIDRRKDGSYYPAQTTVAPVRSERGEITHYVGMQRDMTEQHRLEEQFRQAQKMEAIGTLVGGIAHDFNNMLSGMLGNLYMAKRRIGNIPEVVHKLEDVEQLGYQAANMIAQLLTFARKGRMEMVAFDFTPFVKESIKMARVSIPENIKLAEKITGLDMIITGDATQLQQVLLNLLNNARDAVMDQPEPAIRIQLDQFEADEGFMAMHPELESTSYARLSVSDNGYGISQQHLDKIFEPFFTTKPKGKGTGLGLAMSYGAIQTHKGMIEAQSKSGEGASFHVYLPLSQAAESSQIQEKETILKGHGETILLVDDEEYIRHTLSDVLDDLGYSVLTAPDGEQALQLFAEHRADIDLVITDIVMPLLGGMEVAKTIRELGSSAPLILMTGYDKQHVTDNNMDLENALLMNKPFNPVRLSRDLRELLDS